MVRSCIKKITFLFFALGLVSIAHSLFPTSPNSLPELISLPKQMTAQQMFRAMIQQRMAIAVAQNNVGTILQLLALAVRLGINDLAHNLAAAAQHGVPQPQPAVQPGAPQHNPNQVQVRDVNHSREFFLTLSAGLVILGIAKYVWDIGIFSLMREAREGQFLNRLHSRASKFFAGQNRINADLANAIENKDLAAVKNALSWKANVNAQFAEDLTPLHLAAIANDRLIVKTLLENGARTFTRTWSGLTPLHLAAQCASAEVVKTLLQHGHPGGQNPLANHGITPMHLAAASNNVKAIKMLITFNANVNLQDKNGDTPLDWARQETHYEAARLLLENKALTGEQLAEKKKR